MIGIHQQTETVMEKVEKMMSWSVLILRTDVV